MYVIVYGLHGQNANSGRNDRCVQIETKICGVNIGSCIIIWYVGDNVIHGKMWRLRNTGFFTKKYCKKIQDNEAWQKVKAESGCSTKFSGD